MITRFSLLILVFYGCGFGSIDADKRQAKEYSVSSHEGAIDQSHSSEENLVSAGSLESTEVGNGQQEDIRPVEPLVTIDKLAKNTSVESTEIGNGNKQDVDPGTGGGNDPGVEPVIVTAAYLTSCILSSDKVDCHIAEGENYDFQKLKVYDLSNNEVPAENVTYTVVDDQLEIKIDGDAQIGGLEVEEKELDLPMNVADESMRDVLAGAYNSPVWGDLEIRFSGSDVHIIYLLEDKMIGYAQGSFNEENGTIVGNWCEKSLKKDGKVDDKLEGSGQLEFHFVYGDNQQPQAEGQWNNGEGTEWYNDWNLNKTGDASIYDSYFQDFDQHKCE